MKRLKLIISQIIAGAVAPLLVTTVGFAMCIGFFPPGRSLPPADNQKTLIVLEDGRQHTIVQPEFNGRLEDFSLVMPAPSEPTVSEAPVGLFERLEDYTNPKRDFIGFDLSVGASLDSASSNEKAVTVIRRDNVGNYTATTIKATDTVELLKWLNDNGYESDDNREEILNYYVKTNGYFVALKVNMSNISSSTTKLDPIDISFPYEGDPMVPTRLLAAMPRTADYIVYVLAPEPYIIPGGDVEYADKVGFGDIVNGDAKPLLGYNGLNQWLVRNKISVDPKKALSDTKLARVSDGGSSVTRPANLRKNVNPSLHEESSGIVRTDCRQSSFNRSTGRADIINTENPKDCRFSYSFDLALGEANRKGGFPILGVTKLTIATAVLLFVIWRVVLVRKYGTSRLLPRPLKTTKKSMQWLEHKSGHRILKKSKDLSPRMQGYRESLRLIAVALVYFGFSELFGSSRNLESSQRIVLLFLIGVIFTQSIITLFIKPTVLQVKQGWGSVVRYFLSAMIAVLGAAAVLVLIDAIIS